MRNKFNTEQWIPNGRADQKFMDVNRKLREIRNKIYGH